MHMKKIALGAAALALVSTSLLAQEAAMPASAATVPAPAEAVIPVPVEAPVPKDLTLIAGTPIQLVVASEVNSSTHRAGDMFQLTVLNDIKVGDTVVIPRGTPASAEITWRTGKGAFGKSGKMEFSLRYIELDGKKIPISGDFRQEGEGNTIATGVGVLAVGLFAGFITGKRARLPTGRELLSQLTQPVTFDATGRISPNFDSAAALAAADAKTPLGQCRAAARALDTDKKREKALEKCLSERME
jgi:hypothetical protein